MVDRQLRRRLSQDLRQLVTGRMTNDAFDDVYFDQYAGATDAAVVEVAEFGYGLYNSDLVVPYRLRGKYAVDKSARRTAARCILFLRTDREYDWPHWPHGIGTLRLLWCIAAVGQLAGLPSVVALLILLPIMLSEPIAFAWPVVVIWPACVLGVASFSFSLWYRYSSSAEQFRRRTPQWRAWLDAGDYDVWPFLRREDFFHARRTAFLFGSISLASQIN
jgi:hypothetical protein